MLTREYKQYTPQELRRKLADYRLSGAKFAEMVGVSQPAMSAYMVGTRRPLTAIRIRIAQVIEELDKANPVEEAATEEPIVVPVPQVRGL